MNLDYKKGGFREIYGNDEIVFDSPGYEIKTITFTRFPFKEYHTDGDTPEIISEKKITRRFKTFGKYYL